MATITFIFYPEMGHLNASFKFAKTLKARGHAVLYAGLPDFEERVVSQGIDFVPMFAELCPKGFMQSQAVENGLENFEALLLLARKNNSAFNPPREIQEVIKRARPDLFVIDLLLPELAALVDALNFPTVLLNTQLFNPWVAERARYEPVEHLRELILCPQAFDFPGTSRKKNSYYVEASIDLERRDVDFPWHKLVDGKRLLYCSFGSQSHLISGVETFFRTLIEAIVPRQDWVLVLAAGQGVVIEELDPALPHVILVHSAPQLDLLQRASVAISHGGFNSIKECIFFGVPMLLFPLIRDHPAIAARVVYHGLGVSASMHKVTVEQINTLLDRVSVEPSYAANIEKMGTEFRRMESLDESARLVEVFLGHRTDRAVVGEQS